MGKRTGLGDRDSSQGVESLGWDRLPGESSAACRAFSMYRDMGAKRSLTFVSRNLDRGRPSRSRPSRSGPQNIGGSSAAGSSTITSSKKWSGN